MTPDASQTYHIKSESHDTLFLILKDTIISNFKTDTNMTYKHVSNDIDSRCGATTIRYFLERHDVKTYTDAPVPNILEDQGTSAENFAPKSQQNSKNVKEFWDKYPSPAIARGHILAYRLRQISLDMDRGNEYLGNGFHDIVRQDFINTDDGMSLVHHI